MHMIREGKAHAIDGSWAPVKADTVCLHGDGAHALAFAHRIRDELTRQGIAIRAPRTVAADTLFPLLG